MIETTIETTPIYLSPIQAKQFMLMEFLNSIGVFDTKLGRVIIDFDAQGKIGNVSITHNYKVPEIDISI